MPLAVLAFAFDPYLRIGDRAGRLETLGVAVAILVGLLGAAVALGGLRRSAAALDATRESLPRFDDLLLVAVAAIPGAVVGGRIGYALIHVDYYAANLGALVDPTGGSLELGLAVVGGTLTAGLLAGILDRGARTWMHVAAVPLLGALAIAKIATALGGTGQGAFADAPFATSYLGVGPWGSLGPDIPAMPSQLVEGLLVLAAAAIVVTVASTERGRVADGRLFLVALGLWALVRFVVAFTWRDAQVAGPLRADQLISLAIAAGSALAIGRSIALARRVREGSASPA